MTQRKSPSANQNWTKNDTVKKRKLDAKDALVVAKKQEAKSNFIVERIDSKTVIFKRV